MRSRCQEVTLPTSTLRSRSFIYISTQRKGQACDDFMYPCSLHLTILYNIPSPEVPSFLSPVTPYSPRGYPLAAPLPFKTLHTPTPVSHSCLPPMPLHGPCYSPPPCLWAFAPASPAVYHAFYFPLDHSAIPGPQLRHALSRKTRSVTISQPSASTAASVTHK